MNLFNFPIKRPVTIIMGMFMVVVIGLLALSKMPLDLMPEMTLPNLMVMVVYDGAGPEEVEERLAKPLEGAVKTTANVKNVKVTAQENMCLINAEFNWGTDLDAASSDLREKISMVREYLPDTIDEPIVMRINLQEMPVVFLHIDDTTGRRNLADLADISNDQVAPMLERLNGVASATTMGGLSREIQVNVDRDQLKRYGLSFTDIINAIRYRNMNLTVGDVDSAGTRFRIIGKSEFQSTEELGSIIVGKGINSSQQREMMFRQIIPYKDPIAGEGAVSPIRLRDVAQIINGYTERQGIVRIAMHGQDPSEGVGMAVMKETDANMVSVAKTVKKALDEINDALPEGVGVHVSFDLSDIILDTLTALSKSALEGAIMAAVVIFLFLWKLRPSIIICLAIPLSLLGAFVCMFFADYTLNLMTLGGMVIAIGKLVDDSIVVLENVYRHLAMGKDPFQAAEDGFREVATAVISATLIAVIIFLPVAFTEGLSAQLFTTFAGTVFFALMASLIVSFTAVPMLCSRLLKSEEEAKTDKKKKREVFSHFRNIYGSLIGWALESWGKVLVLIVAIMALTVVMAMQMSSEFIPRLVGGLYEANLKLPKGTTLEETAKVTEKIQERLLQIPDYNHFFMVIGQSSDKKRAAMTGQEQGTNQAMIMTVMNKKVEGRTTTDQQLRDIWDDFARKNPSLEIDFKQAGSADFSSSKPIEIKISGDDFDTLRKIADNIATLIAPVKGVKDVTSTLQEGVPEYNFRFNRDKLASYGMPSAQALMEAKAAIGGEFAHLFREAGKEFDITVRLKEEQRDEFQEIGNVWLTSPLGFQFPLRDVAEFEYSQGPAKINRENSKRIVKVEANKTDRPLSDIVKDIKQILDGQAMPEGYFLEFGGEQEDQQEAFADLSLMFLAALLLVYMVLASLYESFIHPITIMVPIPLAFTGAIILLFITGTPIGVTAFIGIIMLVGIVATNSIVLMDFIITYHRGGMDRTEAIIEAGKARLRPILMTAMTTLFGVLPIAYGSAEGMELMQPMGIVVVGGLISSTFLTLIVIPVFYQIFDDFSIDMKNLFRRKKKDDNTPVQESK